LALACHVIGTLHLLGRDTATASRYTELARGTVDTTPLSRGVVEELEVLIDSSLASSSIMSGDLSMALHHIENEYSACQRGEFEHGVCIAELHHSYILGLEGRSEDAIDIVTGVIDKVRCWDDMIAVETSTMRGAATRGMSEVSLSRTCVEAVCVYTYAALLLSCGAYEEGMRRACQALELALECFEPTASLLRTFEHLFKVAAGCQQGSITEVKLVMLQRKDALDRCVADLDKLRGVHSRLSLEDKALIQRQKASPVKRTIKRRVPGVQRHPTSLHDDKDYARFQSVLQSIWWNTIR